MVMPRSLIVQIGSRNCIGFGSGVLGGFAFAFAFWALGSGLWALVCSGLWAGLWALGSGLGWASEFWGVLGGFCFCFCSLIFGFGGRLEGSAFCFCFLAGLDWAGLGCRWAVAGLFSRNRNCIGFGSGVLPGFAFCFCNLIFGCGGRLAGSAFCLCFLAGAGLGCRWVVFPHV